MYEYRKLHMNRRQTQFGLHLAQGFTPFEAALAVGYTKSTTKRMADPMARHPQMRALVAKLKNGGGINLIEPAPAKQADKPVHAGQRSLTINLSEDEFAKLSEAVVKKALAQYLAGAS